MPTPHKRGAFNLKKQTSLLLCYCLLLTLATSLFTSAYAMPVSDGFDFPVGKPNGTGYAVTGWDFLDLTDKGVYHPGEDWNGSGGGDTDLGAPVYAISNGTVVHSGAYGAGWGNIIVIEHQLPDSTHVWSQYAHLKDRMVVAGWNVDKERQIGTIGKGHNNEYWAHLHFEIRKENLAPSYWPVGLSKAQVSAKYYNPTDFIKSHRTVGPSWPPPNYSYIKLPGGGVPFYMYQRRGTTDYKFQIASAEILYNMRNKQGFTGDDIYEYSQIDLNKAITKGKIGENGCIIKSREGDPFPSNPDTDSSTVFVQEGTSTLRPIVDFQTLERMGKKDEDVPLVPKTTFTGSFHKYNVGSKYGPNLTVQSISAPSSANLGERIEVSCTEKNDGDIKTEGHRNKVYLSSDSTITTSDHQIGSYFDIGFTISPNSTRSFSFSGYIPTDISPGTYYIGAILDVNDSEKETDEDDNNDNPSQIEILPVPTRIIRLAGNLSFGSVQVGTNSQKTLTIYNDGNSTLNVSSISYPTGFGGNWNGGDISAGSQRNVTVTFSPTQAKSYSGTITVNSNKTSGTNTTSASGTGTSHTVTIIVGPTAIPNPISSGGAVSLSMEATDSQGHDINYSWTVNPVEGNLDNPSAQNSIWTAPENCTGADKIYTITATATCGVDSNVKDTETVQVTVNPKPHSVTIITGATANPTTLPSSAGGPVALSVDATDSCGHAINYSWDVSPDEGSFDDATKQEPVWTAPSNNTGADKTYVITVTTTCSVVPNVEDTGTVQVTVPGGLPAVIKPLADSPQQAGAEFIVDIKVEDVTNLFGISLVFNYDTTHIDALSAEKGDFLGGDVIFLAPVIADSQGTVSIGITRKRPSVGVDGSGVVAKVRVKSASTTPGGTSVDFTIADVSANAPNGTNIQFAPETLTVEIISLCVWPGDTNNDGKVNQADVLPLGLHWARTGSARPNASSKWECQPAQSWNPETATFADANGSGFVDQADVLPIGLNWGLTGDAGSLAPVFLPQSSNPKQYSAIKPIVIRGAVRNQFTVGIKVEQVSNLFGIAFAFKHAHSNAIKPLSIEAGDFLGSDVIFYPNVDDSEGTIRIGISRKRPQSGVSGSGIIAKITFQSDFYLPAVRMTIGEITATDSGGRTIISGNTLDAREDSEWLLRLPQMPDISQLFQNFPNPFNPETWIPFQLKETADVTISIYDASGKVIRDIDLDEKPAGFYTSKENAAYWDGRNTNGEEVASGVYFYAIRAGKLFATKKMIIVR